MRKLSWRLVNSFLVLLYAGIVLSLVRPVMRESDQASLISGSVELARDKGPLFRADYNYSRQYGSYWILSFVYRITNLHVDHKSSEQIVLAGNLTASLLFLAGLAVLIVGRGPGSWWEWAGQGAVLLSPVVLFSAPLLSSNLFSAGFLCLLVFVLGKGPSLWRVLSCGLLGFLAVASRADAALVLPLISLLSIDDLNVKRLFGDFAIWALGLCSVCALILGEIIMIGPSSSFAVFFKPVVAGTYLVFGLGSVVLALFGGVLWLLLSGRKHRNLHRILIGMTLLVPLLFYGRLLYTPRHLFTTALGVFFFFSFDVSRNWFRYLVSDTWGRRAVIVLSFLTVLPVFFGIQLTSLCSGNLTARNPTLYPTADGYWPMGCSAQFALWLREASAHPIDHNQRVWAAWAEVEELPSSFALRSSGLVSFGNLQVTLLGCQERISRESPNFIIDGRSISKMAMSVSGGAMIDRFEQDQLRGELLGRGEGEEIYLDSAVANVLSGKLAVRLQLRSVGGGDDYVLLERGAEFENIRGAGPFRWFFFPDPNGDFTNSDVREVIGGRSAYLKIRSNEKWIARSALPIFFRVSDYEN